MVRESALNLGFGETAIRIAETFVAKPPLRWLVADAIRDVTRPGELVLDGFLGSGTTLIAAERTGRRFVGCDIDPAYVELALDRWSAMTGAEPVFEATGDSLTQVRLARAKPSPG
jgi:hypothetical protein